MSLTRIGWRFETPFTVRTDQGVLYALTATSPALISHQMQISWKRMLGVQAGKTIGLSPGQQVDVSVFQKAIRAPDVTPRDRALLRAFATQAVWSRQRLCTVGYDINFTCEMCGADGDSLGHRLFECPCTEALRVKHLSATDLEWLKYSAAMGVVGLGVQVMPSGGIRPEGLGHEMPETWTLTGQPISDVLQGELFIDGSCYKQGPPLAYGRLVGRKDQQRRGAPGLGARTGRPATSRDLACLGARCRPSRELTRGGHAGRNGVF